VVQLLLENEDIDADPKNNYGRTPLSWAAEKGHEAVVRLLLARKSAYADSKDNNGLTPLSYAVRHGHQGVIQLLAPLTSDS
jgi:ankyrin repeat protein